ncbi:MAG: hypothetical protein HC897_05350 [Thermoanaerobaculia bacterium]|nr:hypothetical protein [Thermoanaerobaculia bacterium]
MWRYTRHDVAAACFMGLLLIASPGHGTVCAGTSWSNIDIYCMNHDDAFEQTPCGETSFSPSGTLCFYRGSPCQFEVGLTINPNVIDVEWHSLDTANCGPAPIRPSSTQCQTLASSVPSCGPERPADPTCPDPNLSAICVFNCGPGVAFLKDVDALAASRWAEELMELVGESCGAYAVMPVGWENNPRAAAKLFFTVGRRIHHVVLSWPRYHAEDAVLEGRFFEPTLGSVGASPLWGGKIANDRGLLRSAGICIHEVGALLGSPHWEDERGNGYSRFPVATLCGSPADQAEGFAIYISTEPKIEGLEARPIVERLRELAKRSAMELVCITPEAAEKRRKLLATQPPQD